MKETIHRVIDAGGPLKYTTLALAVMDYVNPAKFIKQDFDDTLTDMVLNNEINEFKYEIDGRVHSLYGKRDMRMVA